MINLKAYKDIFGKPGEGLHSYRIFNIAIVDVIFTIIGAYIISKFFKFDFAIILISLFLLSIIIHQAFGVKTTLTSFFNLKIELNINYS